MELVVHIGDQEALDTALTQGAVAVAARVPRSPDEQAWTELAAWRAAAQKHGLKFYLVWDGLLWEGGLAGAADKLAQVVRLDPDALQLRDLGLFREARRLYPELPLMAAGNWGAHNSPGVRLAESLGFSRVVLEGPVNLKDLALIQRQTALPLAVSLPPFCRGYASLCLLEEYAGFNCETCCLAHLGKFTSKGLMEALETCSGLSQLGVAAVELNSRLFAPASLAQVIQLFQSVTAATPMERPKVVAAVRDIVAAFGEGLVQNQPQTGHTALPPAASRRGTARPELPGRSLWVEARDYAEALALSRQWREPLVLTLTPDSYAAFLPDHRRWGPRRLIWRLPPLIRESSLAFYKKALDTLGQGGYNRYVAGDWGAVALIRETGGQVYGDQTLGVRNSWAVRAARELRVSRVCLPPSPRPESWQALLKAAPRGSFWAYLYQAPALALCPGEAPEELLREDWRWFAENHGAVLRPTAPLDLRDWGNWLKQQGIFPVVVALPQTSEPRGQLPAWLNPRPRPAPPGK